MLIIKYLIESLLLFIFRQTVESLGHIYTYNNSIKIENQLTDV